MLAGQTWSLNGWSYRYLFQAWNSSLSTQDQTGPEKDRSESVRNLQNFVGPVPARFVRQFVRSWLGPGF